MMKTWVLVTHLTRSDVGQTLISTGTETKPRPDSRITTTVSSEMVYQYRQ